MTRVKSASYFAILLSLLIVLLQNIIKLLSDINQRKHELFDFVDEVPTFLMDVDTIQDSIIFIWVIFFNNF
ncbi:hypothetical protein BKA69DRAFT_1068306 [Paraphysoderma sedebokerense]|nr:hypothetical protein BKA69DRAFT_1068306 [Paraphysoderma sedebokerense]